MTYRAPVGTNLKICLIIIAPQGALDYQKNSVFSTKEGAAGVSTNLLMIFFEITSTPRKKVVQAGMLVKLVALEALTLAGLLGALEACGALEAK